MFDIRASGRHWVANSHGEVAGTLYAVLHDVQM